MSVPSPHQWVYYGISRPDEAASGVCRIALAVPAIYDLDALPDMRATVLAALQDDIRTRLGNRGPWRISLYPNESDPCFYDCIFTETVGAGLYGAGNKVDAFRN